MVERQTGLFHVWAVPVGLALLALLGLSLGESATLLLRYEREAVGRGELWRLLSAHIAHLGLAHTLLNLTGLALVWWLVGTAFSQRGWLGVVLTSALFSTLSFWLWHPELQWYVGLSGVLHGLLLAGALRLSLGGDPVARVLVSLVCAKLAWEQWAGPLPGSEQVAGGAVVVDAHLYGAIAGAVVVVLARWCKPYQRGR